MFQTTNQDITMRIHRYTYVDQFVHGIGYFEDLKHQTSWSSFFIVPRYTTEDCGPLRPIFLSIPARLLEILV